MSVNYLLTRDTEESQRLNEQQSVWSQNLRYNISPIITSKLPNDAIIADVGAGTGKWLMDIAKDHPTWELYGFDISDKQVQYKESDTMHFQIADIKKPFPTNLHGKFDLVHVRLLIFAIRARDWNPCVANLKTILKPGGWIQWDEIDVEPFGSVLRTTFGAKTSRYTEAIREIFATGGEFLQEARQGYRYLREAFHQNDLKDISEDIVSSERLLELRKRATMIQLGVLLGVKRQQMG
jgi:SAM-dependent methyltransferase